MADSKDKDTKQDTNNIDNDFDALLKDDFAASEDEAKDFLDDDDAIDRLLMEDQETEPAEASSLIDENIDESVREIDDFADDNDKEIDALNEELAKLEQAVDTHSESEEVIKQENNSVDEFAEERPDENIDENINGLIKSEPNQETTDSLDQDEQAEPEADDFLSVEFDISDEEIITKETHEEDFSIEESEEDASSEVFSPDTSIEENLVDHNSSEPQLEQVINEALSAQVAQLANEFETVKRQLEATSGSVDIHIKDQRKIHKTLEQNGGKIRNLVFLALTAAVLSLLFGAGIWMYSSGVKSDLIDLTGIVTDMEDMVAESQAETDNHEIVTIQRTLGVIERRIGDFDDLLAELKNNPVPGVNQSTDDDVAELSVAAAQLSKISEINDKIEALQAKVAKLEKQRRPIAKKTRASKLTVTEWVVNLVSFKKEWYAKKKAAEFKSKGIPVEIVQVQLKGDEWHRIQVSGFKTKFEAAAYASRVKKALNLSSVWISSKK